MIKKIIRRFFQGQVVRQKQITSKYLKEIVGSDTLQCLDVGAAVGLLEHWDRIGAAGSYYHVEPHEQSADELEQQFSGQSNHRILRVALAGRSGKRTLTLTNSPTGSSILSFNEDVVHDNIDPAYLNPRRSIEVETLKTQEALDQNGIGRIDLVKLDVQGAEFEILCGLDESRMDRLLCVELELNFHKAYLGQGTFSEVQDYLGKHGLELFDIRLAGGFGLLEGKPIDPSFFGVYENSRSVSSRVWEADLVFFRNAKSLLDRRDTAGLKRLIAAFCIYGFFLDAVKVIRAMKDQNLIDQLAGAKLEQLIHSMHRNTSARWFDYPNPLIHLIRRIANFCHIGPDWYRIQYSHVSLPNG